MAQGEYRVVRHFTNQGEDWAYVVAVETSSIGAHPLVHFCGSPAFAMTPSALSLDDLRSKLREMLAACDKPVRSLIPERLEPAKLKIK